MLHASVAIASRSATLNTMRRVLVLLVVTLVPACAARETETEAEAEALRVCHTVTVEGIDVSEYQGAVDWTMVHNSGREFGIARIADGNHIDVRFAANWAGMRTAGMVRGAYYFFRPTEDVPTQAQHVANAVGVLGDGDLPVTIDVECMCPFSTPGHTCALGGAGCATAPQAAAALMQMVDLVHASTGKLPMIYSSARVWDGASYYQSMAHEPASALWVPGYITGCVAVPMDWTDWQFWQYSDGVCSGCVQGIVPGVSSGADCDRNVWNGTLAQLRAFASVAAAMDGGVARDATTSADASATPDAGALSTEAASRDAFVAALDGPHVDIVRPGDGSVARAARGGGCGCGVAHSPTSAALFFLVTLALIARRSRPRTQTVGSYEGRDVRPISSSRSASTSRSS